MFKEDFPYYDEEVLQDPMLVSVGLDKMSANMVNDLTTKFYGELAKANIGQLAGASLSFDNIVDATAKFGENEEGLFLLINVSQKSTIKKSIKR